MFFSLPLIVLNVLHMTLSIFRPSPRPANSRASTHKPRTDHQQSIALKTFNGLGTNTKLQAILVTVGALVAAAAIVKYNTLIHPFTLADNRHYMFYVFRYSILRAWWVRYALVPIYVLCGWLCWAALRGNRAPSPQDRAPEWIRSPFITLKEAQGKSNPRAPAPSIPDWQLAPSQPRMDPPPTSTALILLLATALSLMTAPLVEPRYFILPWMFWRLHVPAYAVSKDSLVREPISAVVDEVKNKPNDSRGNDTRNGNHSDDSSRGGADDKPAALRHVIDWFTSDRQLVVEVLWSLAINLCTMAVFITKPFCWRAAGGNGELLDDGRVQRFMW